MCSSKLLIFFLCRTVLFTSTHLSLVRVRPRGMEAKAQCEYGIRGMGLSRNDGRSGRTADAEDRGQETGDRRQETGNRRQETGDRRRGDEGLEKWVRRCWTMVSRESCDFRGLRNADAFRSWVRGRD